MYRSPRHCLTAKFLGLGKGKGKGKFTFDLDVIAVDVEQFLEKVDCDLVILDVVGWGHGREPARDPLDQKDDVEVEVIRVFDVGQICADQLYVEESDQFGDDGFVVIVFEAVVE
jgi:hypothetical protein